MCCSYRKDTIAQNGGFLMEQNLPACPVETTLMLIGDKWKVLILRDLVDGTKRFGDGVPPNP